MQYSRAAPSILDEHDINYNPQNGAAMMVDAVSAADAPLSLSRAYRQITRVASKTPGGQARFLQICTV